MRYSKMQNEGRCWNGILHLVFYSSIDGKPELVFNNKKKGETNNPFASHPKEDTRFVNNCMNSWRFFAASSESRIVGKKTKILSRTVQFGRVLLSTHFSFSYACSLLAVK